MRWLWIVGFALTASASALAQSTIYKHVDASGRVTYANKPMKDAVVVEFEPLTTIPSTPAGVLQNRSPSGALAAPQPEKAAIRPAVAVVTPTASAASSAFPSIDAQTQKRRDEDRRKILEDEMTREERGLAEVRKVLLEERQNPTLIAAVRLAQLSVDPTPAQQAEFRANIEKASGRIRGLQSTAAEHEKNIEALKKELGALKP